MEHPKQLSAIDEFKPSVCDSPKVYFAKALKFVVKYYRKELDYIRSVKFNIVSPDLFFQEYVWVVHASGFSAKAVANFYPRLMEAYDSWQNADDPGRLHDILMVCNNPPKVNAVRSTAKLIRDGVQSGWSKFKKDKLSTPELLTELPYIGKVTCFHLARNIGLLDFVKPDLHLVRLAKFWGYADCIAMCKDVRPGKLPLGIVDFILWQYSSTFSTLDIKQAGDR